MREKISVVDYIKKIKIGIILVCLAIFVFIVNAVVSSAFYDSRLSLYKSEKQTLTADLEQAKIDARTSTSGAQEISSGLDMERVAKDDEVFNNMLLV